MPDSSRCHPEADGPLSTTLGRPPDSYQPIADILPRPHTRRMTDNAPWTGKLSLTLDELMAFDAMRAFLETYWKRGLKEDERLAALLSNLNRSVWSDGSPGDPAMWSDWKKAVGRVIDAPGSDKLDPL